MWSFGVEGGRLRLIKDKDFRNIDAELDSKAVMNVTKGDTSSGRGSYTFTGLNGYYKHLLSFERKE